HPRPSIRWPIGHSQSSARVATPGASDWGLGAFGSPKEDVVAYNDGKRLDMRKGWLMNAPGGDLRTQVAPQLDMATVETMSALATLEAYAVTFLGVARQRGGELDLDAGVRRLLRTAQCEHE